MKIGIDARLWNESGVGRYIRNLVRELEKIDKRNDYVLFVLSKDYNNVKFQIPSIRPASQQGGQAQDKNFKFQIIKADVRWHTLAEQFVFLNILNSENLDLVHFPYFSVPIFYNRPFIVTIHDLILHHYPTGEASTLPSLLYYVKLLGYRYVIKHAAQKAKKIITVSNATKQEIIDHLHVDPQKVIITYEGAFESGKREAESGKKKTNKKTLPFTLYPYPYFLYVGNAYPHKNLERLLKAFSDMIIMNQRKNEKLDLTIVFVGKEDFFYNKLKQKVKELGLIHDVVFLGFADDKKLSGLYKNALGLVAPSLMEGFGLPVLEAMEQKCLVLASDIAAHREITEGNAVFFDPRSVDDMRAKLERVYFSDKKEFEHVISQAEKKSKEFSWTKLAERTLEIYESSPSTSSG